MQVLLFLTLLVSPQSGCGCRSDLDTLAARIESNYVAWPIEYRGTTREAVYRLVLQDLRIRSDTTTQDGDCFLVLRQLTEWFHDGHLFVFERPPLSAVQAAELARSTPMRPIDEAAVRARLARGSGPIDPIEGIWYSPGYRIAIVPDSAGPAGAFVGIVLASDSALWKPGHLKARIVRQKDGSYQTLMLADDHSPRHSISRIYRSSLLAVPPLMWGRAAPQSAADRDALDPNDPTRPTLRLVGTDAVVVSIPSHDPVYRPVLDSLVAAHRDELMRRPFLLVDIRGDLGGGSMTTAALVPLLVTVKQGPPIGPVGISTVLASPDNIRYFQRGWNPDSVAERMQSASGQLLPLMRNETLDMPFPNDTVLPNPVRVGVLMDGGVASAGEAFVLQARKSTKVTLFGSNSAGMIDYQSVNVIRLACRERGVLFGYPMIAASATLPKDGLNRDGIAPDVRIDQRVKDPVQWVLAWLRRGRTG